MEIALNTILVDKLDSISSDIKYYINMNYSISKQVNSELPLASAEDVAELLDIRRRVKILSAKLKNKL